MAKNPNTALVNRHVFVTAKTGGGKSQLMRNDLVPNRARIFFWDVDNDHRCEHYSNRRAFLEAAKKAEHLVNFRIGWNGADDQETFTWFCAVVWALLDGNKPTFIVLEELADLEMGQKTLPGLGKILKRGRKYGAVVIGNTQRIQEVPKALLTQAAEKYIGQQDAHDARYVERATGLKAQKMEQCAPLTFWKKSGFEWVETRTKYKKFG